MPRRRRQSARRQFRYGQRAAVLRAVTAAKVYRDKAKPTLELAALSCGSNVKYVQAALVVMRSESNLLIASWPATSPCWLPLVTRSAWSI